jgi:hypothetical protein
MRWSSVFAQKRLRKRVASNYCTLIHFFTSCDSRMQSAPLAGMLWHVLDQNHWVPVKSED